MPKKSLNGLELKAAQWIGLLRWLRELQNSWSSVLKRALRLSSQSSVEDAQECAESLVTELDLGVIPAVGLIGTIERACPAIPRGLVIHHQDQDSVGNPSVNVAALDGADAREAAPQVLHFGASSRLTCAETTRQPSGVRIQVWLCRPVRVLPARRNSVLAVAKSCP